MGCSKAVLRGKFIAIQSYLKKLKKKKPLNKQSNFTPKTTGKRIKKKTKLEKERNHKDPSRNKQTGNERNNSKDNKTKSWLFEKIN